jgi:hypothetical protein
VFLRKEGRGKSPPECDENDSRLLDALDEAIASADAAPEQGLSADEVRAQLDAWISK